MSTLSTEETNESGRAKVWMATTNNFRKGKPDEYRLLGEVDLAREKATFKIGDSTDGFYKVVLETPYNTLNRWIVADISKVNSPQQN